MSSTVPNFSSACAEVARHTQQSSAAVPSGAIPMHEADVLALRAEAAIPIIWVEFAPHASDNPFFFSRRRKAAILAVALFLGWITAFQATAYSMGIGSMSRDLGTTPLQAASGVSLYGWGFAVGPLIMAPLTEELGRYWFYIGSIGVFTILHLTQALAQNTATVLAGRFIMGLAGCIGATVVSGTIADLYPSERRGPAMSLFALAIIIGPGFGGLVMCWVEEHLGWRWIQWSQMIALAIYWPIAALVLCETRAPIILRRRAKALREAHGELSFRYTARSELNRPAFWTQMKISLARPILFLVYEPIVTFFAVWAALVWGVFFIQFAGMTYVFETVYGFNITQAGLTFTSIIVGATCGWLLTFVQEAVYKHKFAKRGIEARLYLPMAAGIGFAVGCMIFGLTAIPTVHWIWPCVGIAILLASSVIIFQACFVYVADCYGSHASSAVAGLSFLRVMVGSSFACFTRNIFDGLTPRWGLFTIGCIALVLAPIPFVAFYKGPWIRKRSPYSKILMAEEKARLLAEGLSNEFVPASDIEARTLHSQGLEVDEEKNAVFAV